MGILERLRIVEQRIRYLSTELKKLITSDESSEESESGGDVSKVGTPANNQVTVWTGDGTAEGTGTLEHDKTTQVTTIGDGLASPEIRVDKVATGAGKVAFYVGGVESSYIEEDASEYLKVNAKNNYGYLSINGSDRWRWSTSDFSATNSFGGAIKQNASSLTVPYVFRVNDSNSGLGGDGSDAIALISNNKSVITINSSQEIEHETDKITYTNPSQTAITGGFVLKSARELITFAGESSKTTTISIPEAYGYFVGVTLKVETALVFGTATTWGAEVSGGLLWQSSTIASGKSGVLGTTARFLCDPSGESPIPVGGTAAGTIDIIGELGTITSGTIEVVLWYYELT